MARLISELNIGDKVKMGEYQVENEQHEPIAWRVIGKNHYADELNEGIDAHVTLLTDKIIDVRGFDAKEPYDNLNYGNPNYTYSNIRQWLNKAGLNWYEMTYWGDAPPTNSGMSYPTGYDEKAGFLSSFSENTLSFIIDTKIKFRKPSFPENQIVTDKVFLLSRTEVGKQGGDIAEGSAFSIFFDDDSRIAYPTQQAIDSANYSHDNFGASKGWYWWLRTPFNTAARVISSSGSLVSQWPCDGSVGIRPALNLKSNVLVSDATDEDGCYTIIGELLDIFEWTLPKIAGQPVTENLSHEEWTAFQDAINTKRAKYNLGNYSFSSMWTNHYLNAGIFNEVITAINEIYTAKGETSQIMEEIRGGVQGLSQGVIWEVKAKYFEGTGSIRDALNNA